jgi:hypothetical protein
VISQVLIDAHVATLGILLLRRYFAPRTLALRKRAFGTITLGIFVPQRIGALLTILVYPCA